MVPECILNQNNDNARHQGFPQNHNSTPLGRLGNATMIFGLGEKYPMKGIGLLQFVMPEEELEQC
jgi:hypothetical protein